MKRIILALGAVVVLPFGCVFTFLVVAAGATVVIATQAGGGLDTAPAMTRPVVGATVSLPFGCTTLALEMPDPTCPGGFRHNGIDLGAVSGTPVIAALDGTVHVVRSLTGYGLHVIVDCGDGITTIYAHLSSVVVDDGAAVALGQQLGTVGSSGNSTGPHLHFEVRRDGVAVDPQDYVALP
ncbi:MAG TPA: M23 family metallopeptidase [Candidatus Dormibacteraeota bacterium]|nr:M23 family metallopeptidase [Candidatus Dormibacteraeota bacterium]